MKRKESRESNGTKSLRSYRSKAGLSLMEVERRSRQIATRRGQREYALSAARLCQLEENGSAPSIFKIASLSEIYSIPIRELLQVYGIKE